VVLGGLGSRIGDGLVPVAAASIGRQRLDLGGERGIRQTRADALRDVKCRGPARHIFHTAVGQFHMNVFGHND